MKKILYFSLMLFSIFFFSVSNVNAEGSHIITLEIEGKGKVIWDDGGKSFTSSQSFTINTNSMAIKLYPESGYKVEVFKVNGKQMHTSIGINGTFYNLRSVNFDCNFYVKFVEGVDDQDHSKHPELDNVIDDNPNNIEENPMGEEEYLGHDDGTTSNELFSD